jgi:regulation of enolase protein 1 (concanavalin A-like superfamily)
MNFAAPLSLRALWAHLCLIGSLLILSSSLHATDSTDIGAVGVAGSDAIMPGGAVQVNGSGADIWGPADSFHFLSDMLTGDGSLVVHVTSVTGAADSHPWAKAGLMVRESLDPGAKEVMVLITPAGKIGMAFRNSTGGDTVFVDGGNVSAPVWLMLDRSGGTFRAFSSTDTGRWTLIASANVAMAPAVRGGLAVTSHDNTRTMTSTFEEFDEIGFGTPPPADNWTSVDIGSAGATGTTSIVNGEVTLGTSSGDMWDQADSCRFAYQDLTGDGSITAHVGSLTNTHPWAKAGVMIRASLVPESPEVAMVLTADNVCGLARRAAYAGASEFTAGAWINPPAWVRLTRTGSRFDGYVSTDGQAWTLVGTWNVTMGSTVRMGLVSAAHDITKTAAATFDQITLSAPTVTTPPNRPTLPTARAISSTSIRLNWTDNSTDETGFEILRSTSGTAEAVVASVPADAVSYVDTGLTPNTFYNYHVRAVRGTSASALSDLFGAKTPAADIDGAWVSADVGNYGLAGSTTESGGTVTMQAGGSDIYSYSDGFRFYYRGMSGDGEIVVRVAGLTNTHPWAKAGVMMRQNLDAWSPNVAMLVTAAASLSLQSRVPSNGTTNVVAGPWYNAPMWVKLARAGNDFTASYSSDGATWTVLGTQTVTMGANIFVGLAACAHSTSTVTTATFDNLSASVSEPPPGGTPPAAPSGLRLTGVTSSTVSLAWYDNASDETAYEVEGGTYGNFAVLATLPANTTTYSDTGLAASTSYNYRVRAVRDGVYSEYSNSYYVLTERDPNTPWTDRDIGAVAMAGSSSDNNGTIAVTGSGTALLESGTDSFHFRGKVMYNSDFTLTARLTGISAADPGARAGFMLTESGAWESNPAVGLFVTAAGTTVLATRGYGSLNVVSTTGPTLTFPLWLRITRVSGNFAGYWSRDGQSWTLIASRFSNTSIYNLGLGVSAHSTSTTATATFDNLEIGPPPGPILLPPTNLATTASSATRVDLVWSDNTTNESGFWVERSTDGTNFSLASSFSSSAASFVDSGLAPSTTYWYRVRAYSQTGNSDYSNVATVTTPAAPPWQSVVWNGAGQFSTTSTTLTTDASTDDIWDARDSGLFVYQPWTGDGEFITKVDSFTNTDPWAKAGIMFRASLDDNAAHMFAALTPQVGVILIGRPSTGATSALYKQNVDVGPTSWLKLVRAGDVFTAYWSRNGVSWTALGSQTLALPSTLYVGFAVSSHNRNASTNVQWSKSSLK